MEIISERNVIPMKWRNGGTEGDYEMKLRWYIPVCVITVLWWGAIFPEFTMTEDTYRVVDESGDEIEVPAERADEIYRQILQADPEEIRIRSALLERIREVLLLTDEESGDETVRRPIKYDVRVTITGTQTMDGETMSTTAHADGTYMKKNGTHYITYHEMTEDGPVTSRMEVCDDFAVVRKTGAIEAVMDFIPGEVSPFVYTTPHGDIGFVARCRRIKYNDDVLAFSVRLDYNLSSGEFEQECEMKIVAEYV